MKLDKTNQHRYKTIIAGGIKNRKRIKILKLRERQSCPKRNVLSTVVISLLVFIKTFCASIISACISSFAYECALQLLQEISSLCTQSDFNDTTLTFVSILYYLNGVDSIILLNLYYFIGLPVILEIKRYIMNSIYFIFYVYVFILDIYSLSVKSDVMMSILFIIFIPFRPFFVEIYNLFIIIGKLKCIYMKYQFGIICIIFKLLLIFIYVPCCSILRDILLWCIILNAIYFGCKISYDNLYVTIMFVIRILKRCYFILNQG